MFTKINVKMVHEKQSAICEQGRSGKDLTI